MNSQKNQSQKQGETDSKQENLLSKKVHDMAITLENLNDRIDYLEKQKGHDSFLQKTEEQRDSLYKEFLSDPMKLDLLKASSPETYEKVKEYEKTHTRSRSWDRGR